MQASVQAVAVPVREGPPCVLNAISVKASFVKTTTVKARRFSFAAGKSSSVLRDQSQPVLRSMPLVLTNRFAALPLEVDSTSRPFNKSPRDTNVPMTDIQKKPGSGRSFGVAITIMCLLIPVAFLGMHTVGGVTSSVPELTVHSSTSSVWLPSQVRSPLLAFTSLPRSSLPLLPINLASHAVGKPI